MSVNSEHDGPIRIGYDATSLLGVRTGVARVAEHFLREIATYDDFEVSAFSVTWRGRHDLASEVPAGVRARARAVPARLARLGWSRFGRPRAEHWTGEVDLVHALNYVAPPATAPVLVTVHDLTFVRYPELCTKDTLTYPRHIQRAIEDGATFHAGSDFAVNELREVYRLPADRVVRIYPGIVPSAGGDRGRGLSLAGAPQFISAFGTIEPRKNLPNLLRAFDIVASRQPEVVLVVVGPDGWGTEQFDAALREMRHADRVRRIGFVTDDDRRALLAASSVLAYPSIYEGFGFPPFEAMEAGVPVVGAHAGSMPEVLSGAALLPDPFDVEAMAEALERALVDPETRASLIEAGRERPGRYTWKRAGEEMAALYRRLARRS